MKKGKKPANPKSKTKKPQTKEEIRKELEAFLSGYDINFEKAPGGEDYENSRRSSKVNSYRDTKYFPEGSATRHSSFKKPEERESAIGDVPENIKNRLRAVENFKEKGLARIEKSENNYMKKSDNKINTLESRLSAVKKEKARETINKKISKEIVTALQKVNEFGHKKNIVLKKYDLKKELAYL